MSCAISWRCLAITFLSFLTTRTCFQKYRTKTPKFWDRWKRNVVDRQVKTAHGAERYILGGRPIFLDAKREMLFPLTIDPQNAIIHKIVVAHGAKPANEHRTKISMGVSLAIIYCDTDNGPTPPLQGEQLTHIIVDRYLSNI